MTTTRKRWQKTLVGSGIAAAVLLGAGLLPIPGQVTLAPRELLLVEDDGTITSTNVGVMLVSREDKPTLLWRLSAATAPIWSKAATQLRLPLDGRAGDRKQETARVDAWYIANAQLGHPVGVTIAGQNLPMGIYPTDTILRIDGEIVTPQLINKALLSPKPLKAPAGVATQHIERINAARNRVRVTINRQGREITLTTHKISTTSTGEPAWAGANNPYRIPSLTGITGSSAGLGLAIAYVQTLSNVDLSNGSRIAATGSINLGGDGRVYIGEIAGLDAKIRGALDDGYDTLIVPSVQHTQALRLTAGTGATVIGATTLESVISALCQRARTCGQLKKYVKSQQQQAQATTETMQ